MKNGNAKDVEKNNETLIQKIYGNNDESDADYEEEPIENDEVISIPEHTLTRDDNQTPLDKYHFAEEVEEEGNPFVTAQRIGINKKIARTS